MRGEYGRSDLSVFGGLDDIFTGVFAANESSWLIAADSDAVRVYGIFVETWISQQAGDFAEYDGAYSALDLRKRDLPPWFREDGLVDVEKTGKRYRVKSVRPDECDMVKLVLQEAGAAAVHE